MAGSRLLAEVSMSANGLLILQKAYLTMNFMRQMPFLVLISAKYRPGLSGDTS